MPHGPRGSPEHAPARRTATWETYSEEFRSYPHEVDYPCVFLYSVSSRALSDTYGCAPFPGAVPGYDVACSDPIMTTGYESRVPSHASYDDPTDHVVYPTRYYITITAPPGSGGYVLGMQAVRLSPQGLIFSAWQGVKIES